MPTLPQPRYSGNDRGSLTPLISLVLAATTLVTWTAVQPGGEVSPWPASEPWEASSPRLQAEVAAAPWGDGPEPSSAPSPDPRKGRMVRMDVMAGPMWRVREVDAMLTTSVEWGQPHGFSAAFHTALMASRQGNLIRVLDVPIGAGVVLRGRLRHLPLYASVGLSAGVLVHRALVEDTEAVRRVDPDFRLPIRFAWTIAGAGVSVALEQGYSVRTRSYERRGVMLWSRHAYRIGLVVGIHFDIRAGRGRRGRISGGSAG